MAGVETSSETIFTGDSAAVKMAITSAIRSLHSVQNRTHNPNTLFRFFTPQED